MLPECCITHVIGSRIIHIRYVLILIPSTLEEEERKKGVGGEDQIKSSVS